MPNREKVIKELDKLADEVNPWKESPPLRCDIPYPLLCDALDLLKEQQEEIEPDYKKYISIEWLQKYATLCCTFDMNKHAIHFVDTWFRMHEMCCCKKEQNNEK